MVHTRAFVLVSKIVSTSAVLAAFAVPVLGACVSLADDGTGISQVTPPPPPAAAAPDGHGWID